VQFENSLGVFLQEHHLLPPSVLFSHHGKEGDGVAHMGAGKGREKRGMGCAGERETKNPLHTNGGGLTGEDDLTEAEDNFTDWGRTVAQIDELKAQG
jgi:hypothetical protein